MEKHLLDSENDRAVSFYWGRGNSEVELWDNETNVIVASFSVKQFCEKMAELLTFIRKHKGGLTK